MQHFNWLSIFVTALVPLVIGFIWYSKAVFGNAWMKASGVTEETARGANMPLIFGLTYFVSVMASFFILPWVDGPGQEGVYDSFQHGAFHGVLLGLMIATPVMIVNALFERRSAKYILINCGFWIVTFTLMGGILDAWNHWPNDVIIG